MEIYAPPDPPGMPIAIYKCDSAHVLLIGGNCNKNLGRGLVTSGAQLDGKQFFSGGDIGYSQSDDSHDKNRKI